MSKISYALVPSPEHMLAGHPERPGRFSQFDLEALPIAERLSLVGPHEDAEQLALSVHPSAYLDSLRRASQAAPTFMDYGDTYIAAGSWRAALDGLAGALAVVAGSASDDNRMGFALVRPPGHHASEQRAGGFCLLNNIAVAARLAQANGFQRVMIVDFDVHHGNGTEAIFARDAEVLYLSTHQWGIYPGTGPIDEVGSGPGEGATINVPLPAGAGDRAFELIGDAILTPAAERHRPDIMLVSAGFDAHWRDPLASLQLSALGFASLLDRLVQLAARLCEGRLCLFLEGGYDAHVLWVGVQTALHIMAAEPAPTDPFGPAQHPEPDVRELVDHVRLKHGLA